MSQVRIIKWWRRLCGLGAAGRWLYSRGLGFAVPYSGSIRASVEEMSPGRVKVSIRDRRALRNHLGSIHAIALANACELASGLAMLSTLPEGMRGIVKGFSIEYFKKARGTITAESTAAPVEGNQDREIFVKVEARDRQGDIVCSAQAHWKVGPKR